MPPYINTLDEQQFPPPYSFPGVQFNAFTLRTRRSALQQYCDLYLNLCRDQEDPFFYRPLFPFIYLCVLDYPALYSDYPIFSEFGYVKQREVFASFPVIRSEAPLEHNVMLGAELSWAFPFISVNAATSTFTGREVIGFQKVSGQIDMNVDADGGFSADIASPAFKVFSRETPQELLPLIRIRTGRSRPDLQAGKHPFPFCALRVPEVFDQLEGEAFALMEACAPGLFSATNLKQFRDAESQTEACYQALVKSEFTFANMSLPRIYEGAKITIFDNASLPLTRTLGLIGGTPRPDQGIEFEALFAVAFNADLGLHNVTNVYVVPNTDAPPVRPSGPCDGILSAWHHMLDEFSGLLPFGQGEK
jgi:hypothetical protein